MDRWEVLEYHPRYEICDKGGKIRRVGGGMIAQSDNGHGLLKVTLIDEHGRHTHAVGHLVCGQFHGDPEPGDVVVYDDGDQHNNDADNLYWADRSYAWELARERHRTRPLRTIGIEGVDSGEKFQDTLQAARAVRGLEKYIVLAAGDSRNRYYRGTRWRWVV